MKQMQILNEAIASDEKEVNRIKKMLFNAEGQLKVHRDAKKRLINEFVVGIPKRVVNERESIRNKSKRIRVTEENCFSIGAEIGNGLIVVRDDKRECKCKIISIDHSDTEQPYKVDGCMVGTNEVYPYVSGDDIEIYLIKDIV